MIWRSTKVCISQVVGGSLLLHFCGRMEGGWEEFVVMRASENQLDCGEDYDSGREELFEKRMVGVLCQRSGFA